MSVDTVGQEPSVFVQRRNETREGGAGVLPFGDDHALVRKEVRCDGGYPNPTLLEVTLPGQLQEERFTPQFTGKGVRLVLEPVPPSLCVVADPQRVAQVLGNLITNALRHTPAGSEVRLGVRVLPTQEVEFRVTDTGDGITQEDLPHVFTRFYRGSKARSQDDGGGSGIGLTIAKSFIEMHGGRIGVENGPGCGSSFWFTLAEVPVAARGKPVA